MSSAIPIPRIAMAEHVSMVRCTSRRSKLSDVILLKTRMKGRLHSTVADSAHRQGYLTGFLTPTLRFFEQESKEPKAACRPLRCGGFPSSTFARIKSRPPCPEYCPDRSASHCHSSHPQPIPSPRSFLGPGVPRRFRDARCSADSMLRAPLFLDRYPDAPETHTVRSRPDVRTSARSHSDSVVALRSFLPIDFQKNQNAGVQE